MVKTPTAEAQQGGGEPDLFTGREELIAAFERNLEHKKPGDHRVLVFYGEAGIGKTALLQKLDTLHRKRYPKALMGRLDFASADTTTPDLLLYQLRRQFPTISFPSFSLALAIYGRRFHPDRVYGNERKELLQWAGPYVDVLDLGLEAFAKWSGLAHVVKIIRAVVAANQHLSDLLLVRAEPWFQNSQSMSEDEFLAQLPLQWAKDFRLALSSPRGESWGGATTTNQDWDDVITSGGPPPLIAFDSYETLWHAGMGRSQTEREMRERWLVDLVRELPEVFWLIGGKDRLSWDQGYDKAWSEDCEQHFVDQLSYEHSRIFLAKSGIHEPAIVEKIVSQAYGVPFYLKLQAEIYKTTHPSMRTPEVFGGSRGELIERLLKHLDRYERATLRLLAAFGIWDQDLFRQAVAHFSTGYPATDAAELGRYWSIEAIGAGRWKLHNEMAQHLQAHEQQEHPANFEHVHRWGFQYFDGPLDNREAKNIQIEDAERLQRALSHATIIHPPAEWVTWLVKRLAQLEKGTIWRPLLAVTERGVQLAEQTLGRSDRSIAALLSRQATLLQQIARYEEAEPLFRRALDIAMASYDPDHPEVAMHLCNLATLLQASNHLPEAEPLLKQALAIDEACYGPDHPNVAPALNNLATLLLATNRQSEAEPLMRRVVEIFENSDGTDRSNLATALNNLALLLKASNHLAEAEQLMRRALAIDEACYGPEHPNVASDLNELAQVLQATNRLPEAEPMMLRALKIDEAKYDSDHPVVARDLHNLAGLLQATDRLSEAEPLLRRALAIDEASTGPHHPNVARGLSNLAMLLLHSDRLAEAEPLMRRALAIDESSNGPDHPSVARDLSNLAQLLKAINRLDEAVSLIRRALAIDETSHGPNHSNVAIRLDILSQILHESGHHNEAETHIRRALEIDEDCYGSNHPNVAYDLNTLAMILKATNQLSESDKLMRQSLHILQLFNRNGHVHPKWKRYLENYRNILIAQGFSSEEAKVMLHELSHFRNV